MVARVSPYWGRLSAGLARAVSITRLGCCIDVYCCLLYDCLLGDFPVGDHRIAKRSFSIRRSAHLVSGTYVPLL